MLQHILLLFALFWFLPDLSLTLLPCPMAEQGTSSCWDAPEHRGDHEHGEGELWDLLGSVALKTPPPRC